MKYAAGKIHKTKERSQAQVKSELAYIYIWLLCKMPTCTWDLFWYWQGRKVHNLPKFFSGYYKMDRSLQAVTYGIDVKGEWVRFRIFNIRYPYLGSETGIAQICPNHVDVARLKTTGTECPLQHPPLLIATPPNSWHRTLQSEEKYAMKYYL